MVKQLILILVLVFFAVSSFAQQKVKDGTVSGGNMPNPDAILELESSNKGLLLPRVELTSTTQASPLSAFVNGMVVFNTAAVNDVSNGVYYCDGTKWVRLSSSTTTTGGWSLTGNAGTNPGTDYIGTSDNQPLVVKTNGTERVHVTGTGEVGIGTNNPGATLDVRGDVVIGTLATGDITTDYVLVADPLTGLVKKVALNQSSLRVLKSLEVVSEDGKITFDTPATITDLNNITLYRNGVVISFQKEGPASIKAEISCQKDDEIRIVQLLN